MKIALRALACLAIAVLLSSAAYAQAGAPTSNAVPPVGSNAGTPPMATNGAPAVGAANATGATRHGPCYDDVQKYCSTVQKGGGRVLACLKQHEGQLSSRCEAGMKRHAEKGGNSAAMPTPVPVPAGNAQPAHQ